jgi:hypothetical protein
MCISRDIAHHALLKQLEDYEADHGCVVVMEAKQVMLRQFQTWEELKMVAIMKPQIMLLPSHTNRVSTLN